MLAAKAREYQVNPEEIRSKINKRLDAEEQQCWKDYYRRSIYRKDSKAKVQAMQ